MIKIELREGWFDKKEKDLSIYKSKRTMQRILENIGEFENKESLEEVLAGIPGDYYFKDSPYISGLSIMCKLNKAPKEAYLGKIVEYTVD